MRHYIGNYFLGKDAIFINYIDIFFRIAVEIAKVERQFSPDTHLLQQIEHGLLCWVLPGRQRVAEHCVTWQHARKGNAFILFS